MDEVVKGGMVLQFSLAVEVAQLKLSGVDEAVLVVELSETVEET